MDSRAKYRDIKERTFEFAVEIVKVCRLRDEKPGVNRTLGRQLLRSALLLARMLRRLRLVRAERILLVSIVAH
jgi:hypothetical protein